jgi:hypothetical protein
MSDIQRIGVGTGKYPSISENDLRIPRFPFYFSTNDITFDQLDRTFDENQTEEIDFDFSTNEIFFNQDIKTFDEN